MHIPDGMLSAPVAVIADVGAVGLIGYAVSWINRYFDQRKVVLMSVLSALIFALQMLNFSVAAGTSGHFAGGAMAGIILGPWPASIVMTAVLFIQALVFKDGGIVALGANVINLGIIAPFLGYFIYKSILKFSETKATHVVAAFIAAWTSITVASLAAGLELWISGRANFAMVMGSMGFWHAIIGIGEGLITAGLVGYLLAVRPDILHKVSQGARSSMKSVALVLFVIALIAASFSFLASSHPDGLEFVYFEKGIGSEFAEFSLTGEGGPLADYAVAGVSNEALSGALAGIIGVVLTGAAMYVVFRRKNKGHQAT